MTWQRRTRAQRRRPRNAEFPAAVRARLLILNAAEHDGVARCVLCLRPVVATGPRSGPGWENVAVAGHIVAHSDGGLPVLGNGRIECMGCSRGEGLRRATLARRNGARRRRGLPPLSPEEPQQQPMSSLGEWLLTRGPDH